MSCKYSSLCVMQIFLAACNIRMWEFAVWKVNRMSKYLIKSTCYENIPGKIFPLSRKWSLWICKFLWNYRAFMTVESTNKPAWEILRSFYEISSITSTRSITFIFLRNRKTVFFMDFSLLRIRSYIKKYPSKLSSPMLVEREISRHYYFSCTYTFRYFSRTISYFILYVTKIFLRNIKEQY